MSGYTVDRVLGTESIPQPQAPPYQRVLEVQELLEAILSFATRETKARCARACKAWSDIALDSLWRSMDTMEPVFSLLSPMTEDRYSLGMAHRAMSLELKFARTVRAKDWTRFNSYATRIKHLRLHPRAQDGEVPVVYSSSVLLEVAHKRRTLSLLPDLVGFEVVASLDKSLLDYATLLIGDKLQRLAIYIPRDEALMESFFEELIERVSKLTELKLWLPFELDEPGECLSTFLTAQRELRVVGLSSNALTSDMAVTLSKLPLLEKVLTLNNDDGISRAPVSNFYPKLSEGAFPSLTTLELVLNLNEACSFLAEGCSIPCMTGLIIRTSQLEIAEDIFRFFSSVSKACPALLELKLDEISDIIDSPLMGDIIFSDQEDDTEVDIVLLGDLMPLLNLARLRVFAFSYHRMLHIDNEDLESLVSGWPRLEELTLSHQPTVIGDRPRLTLSALPMVAQHCPQLRRLALYVNCADSIPPPVLLETSLNDKPSSPPLPRFAHLDTLEFGLSPIDDSATALVAEYLCSILDWSARPFLFAIRLSWHFMASESSPLKGTHGTLFRTVSQLWGEVRKMLPVIKNMRARERRRALAARSEIEALRARVRTLEDRLTKYEEARN